MGFISKNDAVSKLTTAITNPSDPNLQPGLNHPIESGNLQNYIQNLLDWIFPPNTTDLRGKVLGVRRVPLTPVTDYNSLEFMTVMPLGGIIMYPLNGVNMNVGANKIRAMHTPTPFISVALSPPSVELDGFLFLDGTTIDTTVVGNEIFKDLKLMLNGMFGNSTLDNLLKLPDMRKRIPLCYDSRTASSPTSSPSETQLNYGLVGNLGGVINIGLTSNQMPNHKHFVDISSSLAGQHQHNNGVDRYPSGFPNGQYGGASYNGYFALPWDSGINYWNNGYTSPNGNHAHQVTGDTSYVGGGQVHENRQEYMVLNYAIKY